MVFLCSRPTSISFGLWGPCLSSARKPGSSRLAGSYNPTKRYRDPQRRCYVVKGKFPIDADIHICKYAYLHTYIHPYIHTYIHTYIQKYIHAYIHMHIKMRNMHLLSIYLLVAAVARLLNCWLQAIWKTKRGPMLRCLRKKGCKEHSLNRSVVLIMVEGTFPNYRLLEDEPWFLCPGHS